MIRKLIALDWHAVAMANKLSILICPVLIFFVGYITSQILVIPFSMWVVLSYSTNPFYSEEKGELNNLFLTLPVKRRKIVAGRYVSSLILLLLGVIMGLAIMPVVRHFSNSQWWLSVESNIAIVAVSILLFAVFNLFMFPLLFKLGYQKGKVWGLYLPAVVFVVLYFGYNIIMVVSDRNITFEFLVFAGENMLLVSGGVMLLSVFILLLSFRLSLRVYLRRDF